MDHGLTHVALTVRDLDRSLAFYERYGRLWPVHRRTDPATGHRVAWLSDRTRPFVVVLIEADAVTHPLGGANHLGIGVASRHEVDDALARAGGEGRSVLGPYDDGPPVGYWGIVVDPDGHQLELSHGQEVGSAVAGADDAVGPPP